MVSDEWLVARRASLWGREKFCDADLVVFDTLAKLTSRAAACRKPNPCIPLEHAAVCICILQEMQAVCLCFIVIGNATTTTTTTTTIGTPKSDSEGIVKLQFNRLPFRDKGLSLGIVSDEIGHAKGERLPHHGLPKADGRSRVPKSLSIYRR